MSGDVEHAARVISAPIGPGVGAAQALYMPADLGTLIDVGREGDLPAGIHAPDLGVSRRALSVIRTQDGWDLTVRNSNGVLLCPWAQPSVQLRKGDHRAIYWPRVAVLLRGSRDEVRHWVLLEADDFIIADQAVVAQDDALPYTAATTVVGSQPPPLTAAQLDGLTTVFAEYLTWPPTSSPMTVKQESAGRRLGVKASAIQQRLEGALRRAYDLGLTGDVALSNPAYLHVLVRHGYVPIITARAQAEPWR